MTDCIKRKEKGTSESLEDGARDRRLGTCKTRKCSMCFDCCCSEDFGGEFGELSSGWGPEVTC